jgi:hypothetical protein
MKPMSNQEKLEKSINYVRSRGIYLLDGGFTPTTSINTDVSKTIERYRKHLLKNECAEQVKGA